MKKVLLLLLLLISFTGFGQQIHNVTVQHNQSGSNPGMEVIADMSLVHRPAILLGSNAHLRNDTLFLRACYFEGPQAMPIQFTDTFQVGNLAAGTYTLHFTMIKAYNNLQCDSVASFVKVQAFTVNEITATKSELALSMPEIFPNPVSDHVRISGKAIQQINLYDLRGRLIKRYDFSTQNSSQISVSDLPKGIYVADLISRSGEICRRRLIKN